MESLSHHERSQLYVVTRQFDRALDNWESLFGEWLVAPGQLDAGGYLRDYLTVAIRVEGSYTRARQTLEKLRGRPHLPKYLEPQLDAWIGDLRRFEAEPPALADVASIHALVEKAPVGDSKSMVADLVASAALMRRLDQLAADPILGSPERDAELAEIYYLLGLVEARSTESFWVPQAPFHLELAIRLDPDAPHAGHALELIEELFEIGYGGLDPDALPLDLWTTLEELRTLVRSAGVPAT
jgi:hypothetical protein